MFTVYYFFNNTGNKRSKRTSLIVYRDNNLKITQLFKYVQNVDGGTNHYKINLL